MGILDFFRKNRQKSSEANDEDILTPRVCPTKIPIEIENQIDSINWRNYKSAYGASTDTIPNYLKNLFCEDKKIAIGATHQLWCSLCHQHAFISPAALPAYDILKIGLQTLDDQLKIELLDIFTGFAACTMPNIYEHKLEDWEKELVQKLIADLELFLSYGQSANEDILYFSTRIVEYITTRQNPE